MKKKSERKKKQKRKNYWLVFQPMSIKKKLIRPKNKYVNFLRSVCVTKAKDVKNHIIQMKVLLRLRKKMAKPKKLERKQICLLIKEIFYLDRKTSSKIGTPVNQKKSFNITNLNILIIKRLIKYANISQKQQKKEFTDGYGFVQVDMNVTSSIVCHKDMCLSRRNKSLRKKDHQMMKLLIKSTIKEINQKINNSLQLLKRVFSSGQKKEKRSKKKKDRRELTMILKNWE